MQHRLHAAFKAALILISLTLSMIAGADGSRSASINGELLVAFKQASGRAIPQPVSPSIGTSAGYHPTLNTYRIQLRANVSQQNAITALKADKNILYAEPNYIRHVCSVPNDPYISNQYNLRLIEAPAAWSAWTAKQDVIVAVIDTGVDYDHPDLSGMLVRDGNGAVVGYNSLTGSTNARDDYGHGTHVAGTIAAKANNGIGVAGVAGWSSSSYGIKILPVKVMGSDGNGSDSSVADGVIWAVNHNAKVINMSLGASGYSNTLNNAVQYAYSKGCVVVAAAGNYATSTPCYPAACTNVISVAATDDTDTVESYSNYGSWVKTAAPGYSILSTTMGGSYGYMSGTSSASPHVAAEAAILCSQAPSLSNARIGAIIIGSVDSYKTHATGLGLATDAGRINIRKALSAIAASLLSTLTISPTDVAGGSTATGSLQLSDLAPIGGMTVALSSSSSIVTVPASVKVLEGALGAQFRINTTSVVTDVTATITATLGSTVKTATLIVDAPKVSTLAISPGSVSGGKSATGSVTLNLPAPTGGFSVTLASSDSAVSVPSTVKVPAGVRTVTFTVATKPVSRRVTATITASPMGAMKVASENVVKLNVEAPTITTLRLDRTTVRAKQAFSGTIVLSDVAPSDGLVITITSSSTSAIPITTVTVPAGRTTVGFSGTTATPRKTEMISITAWLGGKGKSGTLMLTR